MAFGLIMLLTRVTDKQKPQFQAKELLFGLFGQGNPRYPKQYRVLLLPIIVSQRWKISPFC